jgi:hypothetical protein
MALCRPGQVRWEGAKDYTAVQFGAIGCKGKIRQNLAIHEISKEAGMTDRL